MEVQLSRYWPQKFFMFFELSGSTPAIWNFYLSIPLRFPIRLFWHHAMFRPSWGFRIFCLKTLANWKKFPKNDPQTPPWMRPWYTVLVLSTQMSNVLVGTENGWSSSQIWWFLQDKTRILTIPSHKDICK